MTNTTVLPQIVEALESRKVSIISMDCFYKVARGKSAFWLSFR